MATAQRRGKSYTIKVSCGYDLHGKQIIRSKTWTPKEGLSDKLIEKELSRQKVLFEELVKKGLYLDSNITFFDFSKKWLDDYACINLAPRTIFRYQALLERINEEIGHIKLESMQPNHFLKFYKKLSLPGANKKAYVKASDKLLRLLNKDKGLKKSLSDKSGVSIRTINGIINGKSTDCIIAYKVSTALNLKNSSLFEPVGEQKGLSAKTITHYHRLISSMLATAVQWQLLPSNPAERVKPPKVESKEARYLNEKQAKDLIVLLDKEDIKYRTAILMLIYSGLRRGELCGLEWKDVDFDKQLIHVRKSVQYLPGKGIFEKPPKTRSGIRDIKLDASLFSLLDEYKLWQEQQKQSCGDRWKDSDKLFTQWDGDPMHPDTLTGWFGDWAKKNNLDISLHSLRHTNATLLIYSGVSPRVVADRLGHAQPSTTTNIYSHAIKSASDSAADVLYHVLHEENKKE